MTNLQNFPARSVRELNFGEGQGNGEGRGQSVPHGNQASQIGFPTRAAIDRGAEQTAVDLLYNSSLIILQARMDDCCVCLWQRLMTCMEILNIEKAPMKSFKRVSK